MSLTYCSSYLHYHSVYHPHTDTRSIPIPLSFSLSFSLSISLSLTASVCLPFSQFLSLSFFLTASASLPFSPFLYNFHSHRLCLFLPVFLSLSFTFFLSRCLCLCFSVFLSFSLIFSLCLCLFLPRQHTYTYTYSDSLIQSQVLRQNERPAMTPGAGCDSSIPEEILCILTGGSAIGSGSSDITGTTTGKTTGNTTGNTSGNTNGDTSDGTSGNGTSHGRWVGADAIGLLARAPDKRPSAEQVCDSLVQLLDRAPFYVGSVQGKKFLIIRTKTRRILSI